MLQAQSLEDLSGLKRCLSAKEDLLSLVLSGKEASEAQVKRLIAAVEQVGGWS